jgi:hypothetical protein
MGFLGFPWFGQRESDANKSDTGSKTLFEFGNLVPAGGTVLRGVCTGDDPEAIQACTWSVEKVQQGKKPRYRVEF